MDHFGYDKTDVIGCEMCGTKAVDIHHVEPKGMGGSKTKDYIENLIAVCRVCHEQCHDSKDWNETAKEMHVKRLGELI